VVTTPIGAEGYGAVDGESILIGKTSAEVAAKAIEVLKNRSQYDRLAKNARQLVDTKFSWGPIAQKLERIYEEVVHHYS